MRTSLNELLDINLSYEEILDNLSEQTNDFTDLEGEVAFDDQYEAEVAMSILKNHYENVENNGLDIMEALDDTSVFTITFSSPIVDDFSFPEEEIKEGAKQIEYFKHKNESLNEELKPIPKGTTIVELPRFSKIFKKLGFNDNDLQDLENSLFTYPPDASLGSGVYKFR